MPPFTKVLVANRSEIAVRVFRTLRELEISTVAVYSEPDRSMLHVSSADEAFLIGSGPAADSYLRGDRIIEVAERAGADAIHPGYGFLAENAAFARQVTGSGLVWIGPPPEAIEAMGSKIAARERMQAAGVPIIPGSIQPAESADEVLDVAAEIGYPIAIKASAGGGGKGLRIARAPEEVERAYEAVRREGEAYFADPTVYVERYLDDPRHVEVQILADRHGAVVHLGERDCTIQRRHQKLVEETPSPAVGPELRERIGSIAVDAARAVGYQSAGTIEGLLTPNGSYYFLEMNTRIQVEHTVTEAVTGIDLVREQVLIAAGEPLSFAQEDVVLRGHAIECRINAEDVTRGFLPTPGRIEAYREPGGIGVRVDSGVRAGDAISDLYDPLIAKLVVHDVDREGARRRALRALGEFVIEGPKTLIGFHRALLSAPCFVEGGTCKGIVESEELAKRAQELDEQLSHETTTVERVSDGTGQTGTGQTGTGPTRTRVLEVELDGRRHEIRVHSPEPAWAELARRHKERSKGLGGEATGAIVSPMQGTVLEVAVAEGDEVDAGALICVVEAMKMENEIVAHRDGFIAGLRVGPGEQVAHGDLICRIETELASA
ncbi:MAG: acetyl-CoA carboxylase biotin carboxylase subunit [Actinobacteria bacterium]|nr:acetyl-CoA carboxylase biotin carboxylase subunit [Actinomycetota bacterium]